MVGGKVGDGGAEGRETSSGKGEREKGDYLRERGKAK